MVIVRGGYETATPIHSRAHRQFVFASASIKMRVLRAIRVIQLLVEQAGERALADAGRGRKCVGVSFECELLQTKHLPAGGQREAGECPRDEERRRCTDREGLGRFPHAAVSKVYSSPRKCIDVHGLTLSFALALAEGSLFLGSQLWREFHGHEENRLHFFLERFIHTFLDNYLHSLF